MRSKVVKILALAFVVGGVGMVMGQQNPQGEKKPRPPKGKVIRVEEEETPRPKQQNTPQQKSKLEEMLAEALKNNADIRVAVAKLAEAEAELNRTRIQVTQQVATLHHAIVSQKATVDYEQKRYERMKTLSKQGSIDLTLLDEGLLKLTAAKAKLAELETQVPGLLGKMSQDAESGALSRPTRGAFSNDGKYLFVELNTIIQQRTMGPMAEKIRKALDRTISADCKNQPLTTIVDDLSSDTGLVIKVSEASGVRLPEKLSIRCENLPVSAILQLLEDSLPYYTVVVRDYGLLITHSQFVPPGAISVQEFLRQKPVEK